MYQSYWLPPGEVPCLPNNVYQTYRKMADRCFHLYKIVQELR